MNPRLPRAARGWQGNAAPGEFGKGLLGFLVVLGFSGFFKGFLESFRSVDHFRAALRNTQPLSRAFLEYTYFFPLSVKKSTVNPIDRCTDQYLC